MTSGGDAPADAARVVVGAAVVRDGRVLAARRSAPPELAGGWEFPGGKVEPDETDAEALARECREELGVEIAVGALLTVTPVGERYELRVHLADLLVGEPTALVDHDALRWLSARELDDVTWLPADVAAVEALRRVLVARP